MTAHNLPSRDEILALLRASANHSVRSRDLASRLGIAPEDYPAFRTRLRELEREGLITRKRRGGLVLERRAQTMAGRLELIRSGDGFVVPDQAGEEDVFVPAERLSTAVEGDHVLVRVRARRKGRNPEGEVVQVLHRAVVQAAGVYHARGRGGTVRPQEPPLRADVRIPADLAGDARDGDVVQVAIREWGRDVLRPVGEVVRVLGRPEDPGVDVLSIVVGHGLPLSYPTEARREADRIERRGIRPEDEAGREDLRAALTFTIDPANARDHDDALSAETLDDGTLEVGVHIADVSYYVKPGSKVDREARDRATSVYLVDRVIPMLPESLSGGLCSLVQGRDRLTLSVFFRASEDGLLRGHRVARTMIRSGFRLSYEEAQALLDGDLAAGGEGERILSRSSTEVADLQLALRRLDEVSRTLYERRKSRGAIDFEVPEAEVILGPDGYAAEVRARRRLGTHRIVEELMILANEHVAEWGGRRGLPLVYRVHEEPDEDRIDSLRALAHVLGYSLPAGRIRPRDLARLVRSAHGTSHAYLVSSVALRSMKQARYSTRNVGHYGLASSAYVHFTSPIRRYPDLLVHREVVARLEGRSATRTDRDGLERVAQHASQQERRAEAAERDCADAKKIEYMLRHIGDEFEGTVSGVTGFGLFVLLDNLFVEGLVRLGALRDDFYVYDERSYAVFGRRTRRRLQLGDRLCVQVVRVDRESRQVDLELLPGPLDQGGGGG